jgi:hypothetical protein
MSLGRVKPPPAVQDISLTHPFGPSKRFFDRRVRLLRVCVFDLDPSREEGHSMHRLVLRLGIVTSILCLVSAQTARATDESVAEEILGILRANGQIGEQQYHDLLQRARDEEAERDEAAGEQLQRRLPKLSFFGDLIVRHESFWFDEDELGNESENRYRTRYRLRVGAQAKINDRASVLFRIRTGSARRSHYQTLGDGPDGGFFDPDEPFIDRAYVKLHPLGSEPFPGGSLVVEAGRLPNPFIGTAGKDRLLWDNDIALEGASLKLATRASETIELYANGGYYVLEENSSAKDPHLAAAQAGVVARLNEALEAGARASGFFFHSLNEEFMDRATSGGNLLLGLTGDPLGESLQAGELFGYLRWGASEKWPVTLYGTVARNFDAESAPGADAEDLAYGFGLEIGDAKKLGKLGGAYFHMEANAFPALFVDSDVFDGKTNRVGFMFYGLRRIWKNTNFRVTLLVSDEIEDDPIFATSVADAERYRLRTDLMLNF